MPSPFAHPAPALTLAVFFRSPRLPARVVVAGVLCSVAPDLDTVGRRLGLLHGHLTQHRCITHSIAFAVVLALVAAFVSRPRDRALPFTRAWLYLFLATASHGFLDAFTNGGRGVAFFAPFSEARYFFPWRPIEISPLDFARFWQHATIVLRSEAIWVWTPSVVIAIAVAALRGRPHEDRRAAPIEGRSRSLNRVSAKPSM
jgi:inner membrane protein